MKSCEVCHNQYENIFEVILKGKTHLFDSFECAIFALAPICHHCKCKVIGHGVEKKGIIYCSAHCARQEGHKDLCDQGSPSFTV